MCQDATRCLITLGILIRERTFQRIQLRGRTLDEVGRFVGTTSDAPVPAELIDAVHSRTESNPLFVAEVGRRIEEEGFEDKPVGTLRIPEGIRDAIGRRLNGISDETNKVLLTASVVGREFTSRQLDRLVDDMSEDELLVSLEEASKGYLVEEVEDRAGTYRFTHALMQQTLASDLSTARKLRTHGRIADMLEELYGENSESHAEELAHHYFEASAMIGPQKMVRYSMLVGQKAPTSYAYDEARTNFDRALGGKEGQAMDSEALLSLPALVKRSSSSGGTNRLRQI